MVKRIKVLAAKSDGLSSFPHMVEEENRVPQAVLLPPHARCGMYTFTRNKILKIDSRSSSVHNQLKARLDTT